MRRPRLLLRNQEAVYHCMSRTVGGQFLFMEREKEAFRRHVIRLARFLQVSVQTFCTLANHFHLILRLPAVVRMTDQQLVTELQCFYGQDDWRTREFERLMLKPDSPELEQARARYLARMGNLSVFMKELKESFTKWFNEQHGRFGTLWAERFKSVLIPNFWAVIMTVAAYVDLNGVRAGLAPDPKDYRFCGYAEALARDGPARDGLSQFLPGDTWEEKIANYRCLLFAKGERPKEGQASIDPDAVMDVLKAGGKLSLPEVLRLKVRYFSESIALGNPEFIEEVFHQVWKKYCSVRQEPSYPMEGADWKDWVTLRKLKEAICRPKQQPQDAVLTNPAG